MRVRTEGCGWVGGWGGTATPELWDCLDMDINMDMNMNMNMNMEMET